MKDWDQRVHLRSLIKVFSVRLQSSATVEYVDACERPLSDSAILIFCDRICNSNTVNSRYLEVPETP